MENLIITWVIGFIITAIFQVVCGIWKRAWPTMRNSDRNFVIRRRLETMISAILLVVWPVYLVLIIYYSVYPKK